MASDPPTPADVPRDKNPAKSDGETSAPAEPLGDAAEEAFFNAPQPGDQPEPDDDELDPELLNLPRKRRRRRHPLVSVLVLGLSLYLIWFLRGDLAFFFHSRTPTDVGHVTEALEQGRLKFNDYVRVEGAPDRKHAVLLEARFGGYDTFFRLHRSKNRVFVQRHRASRTSDNKVSSIHVGQVVRFGGLPYRKSIRQYLSKSMSIAHEFSFKAIKAAKARGGVAGPVELVDQDGETARLSADSEVWVNVVYPNEWLVQFSKKVYTEETQAIGMLTKLDLPAARDSEPSRMFWRFTVLANPEQAKALMARFRDRKLHVGVVRRQLSYSAKWDQLRVSGDTLLIDARDPTFPPRFELREGEMVPVKEKVVHVPKEAVQYITTASTFLVPDDAMVILADREPGDYWYYALLFFVLLGFSAVNCVILVQHIRRWRADKNSK